jgi:hypothetical protein
MRHLLLVPLALVAGACAAERGANPPKTELAKALYFSELDHREHAHGLSQSKAESGDKRAVERVPWGRPIDSESRLEIELLDAQNLGAQVAPGAVLETAQVRGSVRVRRELIDALPQIYAKREAALRAYDEARSDAEFETALAPFLELESELLERFDALYPDEPQGPDAAQRLELRRSMAADFSGAFSSTEGARKFSEALQREIVRVEQQLDATLAQVRRREARLRIEAFLSRGDTSSPTALHVEGYDTIDEKRVASSDRFGLLLSAAERAELVALLNDAKALSEALNRARASGAKLSDALREVRSELARKLADQAADLEALAETIRGRETLLRETGEAFEQFLKDAREVLADAGDQALADAVQQAREQLAHFEQSSAALQRVLALLDGARELRELWRNASAGDVLPAIEASVAWIEALGELDSDLETLAKHIDGGVVRFQAKLKEQLAQLAASTRGELQQKFDVSLGPKLKLWGQLGEGLVAKLRLVGRLLGVAPQLEPVSLDVQAPNVVDVPIEDAPDTFVALKGSTARVGDTLEVRASLLVDGKVESSSSALFSVARLGWHAQFAPSVVLVSADKLAGQSDDAGFSPALAWMLRYTPRPDQDDWWDDFSRWTRWGIGPHAALLNFDPDNDTEIGLGLTVGMWGEILQFGAGYNLMADSSDEAQIYYYVGSSLIPMLQALDAD